MNIVITQRVQTDAYGQRIDSLEQTYAKFWQSYGLIVPIPNTLNDLQSFMSGLNVGLIVLSGGGTVGTDTDRDVTERSLLEYAIAHCIPVIGICRGAQMINVFFGGTLLDNISGHVKIMHPITIDDKIFTVNSYHNQGFTEHELAKNLKSFAKAEDGIIEGFRHSTLPILGIMWHPERDDMKKNTFNTKLINELINKKI